MNLYVLRSRAGIMGRYPSYLGQGARLARHEEAHGSAMQTDIATSPRNGSATRSLIDFCATTQCTARRKGPLWTGWTWNLCLVSGPGRVAALEGRDAGRFGRAADGSCLLVAGGGGTVTTGGGSGLSAGSTGSSPVNTAGAVGGLVL